jgi:glycosyltransferase involved in cell wall biosynthesis
MNPKVSIIIPFYNCPYIAEAINSALNQSYRNLEVIVVDDGSTAHVEKIHPYYNRIKYIRKENGGTATALNRGIQEASGQYFSWLSSDDRYLPKKIEMQVAFMEQEHVMGSYGPYNVINEHGNVIDGPIGEPFENKYLFYKRLKAGCPINGCTVMLNMKVFNEIELFDESLSYTHDYEFWLRFIQKYDMEFFNVPLLEYRVHDEMGTKKYANMIKNEIRLVKKRYLINMRNLIKKEVMLMTNSYGVDRHR